LETRNQLLNLVQEWEQPKPKEFIEFCLKMGLSAENMDRYGYGELKFIMFIRELKLNMMTNQLQRIDRDLQEDMVIIEKQESDGLILDHIRKVFTTATGHLSRAILKSVQIYERKTGKEKRKINNDVEVWHRKKSY
jgi:hypothetical protein